MSKAPHTKTLLALYGTTLKNIQSQGCDVAPVGHHDGIDSDIQWRISFPGEQTLVFDLNDVQILCYALIKICGICLSFIICISFARHIFKQLM
jgi:hypothetical protein